MPRPNPKHMRAIHENRDKLGEWETYFFQDMQRAARKRWGISPKQAQALAEMAEKFSTKKDT